MPQQLNEGYYNPETNRRRKLSVGAMNDICSLWREGESVHTLAEAYGVSKHLIYTVVYWTPREVQPVKMRQD